VYRGRLNINKHKREGGSFLRRVSKKIRLTLLMGFIMTMTLSTHVVGDSQDGFSDITEDSTHYEAIMALSQEGIINGYEDGTFRQWESVSRAQGAVILYKTLNMRGLANIDDILDKYDDIDSDSRYANEIAAVTYAGIFKGNQGKFRPY